MKHDPVTEKDVKAIVKEWFDARLAWSFAPVMNGMGVHGIHDRIGCIPVVITPGMVGKTVGLFGSIEAKRPGRRDEPRQGMSIFQFEHMNDIRVAGGFSIVCDGRSDLDHWQEFLNELGTR